jgi:homogentisate 1,2-dioxygenase
MFYIQRGQIPHKRHTQFRKPEGQLYFEQLFGEEGFSGKMSLLYHINRPTQISLIEEPVWDVSPSTGLARNIHPRKFFGFRVPESTDLYLNRNILMFNQDTQIGMLQGQPSPSSFFFKNADGDELWFVHHGKGMLKSMFGHLAVKYGDYVVIPKGTIYQWVWDTPFKLFYVESAGGIDFPKRYKNHYGQFLEHAPFCERDIQLPDLTEANDAKGDYVVKIKKQQHIHSLHYVSHPFDVIGWDGCVYPFSISIHDFEPITGRVHQPPPVHQTFAAPGLVVCSFVPRLYDYHPEAIPAPYHHSNVDSDELLYYVDGDFMSRTGVEPGQMTLHPMGLPHGPHPGTIEKSIGAKATQELAVMVDTFRPLALTELALQVQDTNYAYSWIENNQS